jgi:hypothetical protein
VSSLYLVHPCINNDLKSILKGFVNSDFGAINGLELECNIKLKWYDYDFELILNMSFQKRESVVHLAILLVILPVICLVLLIYTCLDHQVILVPYTAEVLTKFQVKS